MPQRRWGAAATSSLAMVLLQPSLVLVDHGHFQYNAVCLGLAMAAAGAVASGNRRGGERGRIFVLSVHPAVRALFFFFFDFRFFRSPSLFCFFCRYPHVSWCFQKSSRVMAYDMIALGGV